MVGKLYDHDYYTILDDRIVSTSKDRILNRLYTFTRKIVYIPHDRVVCALRVTRT